VKRVRLLRDELMALMVCCHVLGEEVGERSICRGFSKDQVSKSPRKLM